MSSKTMEPEGAATARLKALSERRTRLREELERDIQAPLRRELEETEEQRRKAAIEALHEQFQPRMTELGTRFRKLGSEIEVWMAQGEDLFDQLSAVGADAVALDRDLRRAKADHGVRPADGPSALDGEIAMGLPGIHRLGNRLRRTMDGITRMRRAIVEGRAPRPWDAHPEAVREPPGARRR